MSLTPWLAADDALSRTKSGTVSGSDVVEAMKELGFANYAEALKLYINRYHQQNSSVKITQAASNIQQSPAAAEQHIRI